MPTNDASSINSSSMQGEEEWGTIGDGTGDLTMCNCTDGGGLALCTGRVCMHERCCSSSFICSDLEKSRTLSLDLLESCDDEETRFVVTLGGAEGGRID